MVGCDGVADGLCDVGVWLGEGWNEPGVGADEVGDDGDFAVALVFAAADADGGDGDGLGDGVCDLGYDGFEDDGEGAGVGDGEGVCEEEVCLVGGFAFFVVSAFLEDALGEHSEVGADGDAVLGEVLDVSGVGGAAFEFDGFGTGLEEEAGVVEGEFGGVVGVDGEVAEDEGAWFCAGDGGDVVEHVLEGDVGGVWEAEDDHAEGVAYEEEVDILFVEEFGGGEVVGGECGDGVGGIFALGEGGDFLGGGDVAHGREFTTRFG